MDQIQDELRASTGANVLKKRNAVGAAVPLSFPTSNEESTTPNLASLRDNHSPYSAVAKVCLQLNQYALNGSSSAMDDVNSVQSSTLFHDASFAKRMAGESGVFAALMECIQTHNDRRAKIVACKTLALVARATYARIRHSPLLFALRDSTNSRLEDEVGTDIPMALVTAALEDIDDGVAASAIQALGIMALSSSSIPGTLVEDELVRETMAIVHGKMSPHAPTIGALQDEEANIPQMELQMRILDNVIAPRLMQLVCRVTAFEEIQHLRIILPILTATLVHLSKTSSSLIHSMDRSTYAKRWLEVDFINLINDFVHLLLLPAMQSSMDGQLAYAAALSSIRLLNACPHAVWVPELSHWTILVLTEEADTVESFEAKLTIMASLLICCRAVPFPERLSTLELLFTDLQSLPSTTVAPHGIASPGLLLEYKGISHYRRPTRVAFLAEIALSFFMDGPVESLMTRAVSLETFLKSVSVSTALKEAKSNETATAHLAEEMVAAFCMVAVKVGRQLRIFENGEATVLQGKEETFNQWISMSVTVLNAFTTCVTWGGSSAFMEEELNMLVAAQASYVSLVQEVLHAAGLLRPTSISFKMAPTASPPNMLWDQMEESAFFLGTFESYSRPDDSALLDSLSKVMEDIVKRELKGSGISSHHMRLFLMALAADQWVQSHFLSIQRDSSKNGEISLKKDTAKELLAVLSPRRVFGKVVESHKSQIDQYPKKKKEAHKKYTQETVTLCVACIENIALFACDWRKRFGKSSETNSLLNNSLSSLQGKSESNPDAQVLPVCKSAVDRIQAAFSSGEKSSLEASSLSPLIPLSSDLKRRPVVTASRSQQSENAYHIGYLMQLSRQIIASRIDSCLLSLPVAYTFQGAARKQSWLRLDLPPIPASKDKVSRIKNMTTSPWGSKVSSSSGGSDAATITLSYSMKRNLRYDGEDEFRLMVAMRVHNITAVDITEGIRLELGILYENPSTGIDAEDETSIEVMNALSAETGDARFNESTLTSAVSLYKAELKSGDHVTWEILLDVLPMSGKISLNPSIVYRALDLEPVYTTLVGGETKADGGESGSTGLLAQTKSQVNTSEVDQKVNITIPGDAMSLSAMVSLQPCPLVFFRDGSGDVDTFRFLWSRVPYQIPPLKIVPVSASVLQSIEGICLSELSTIQFAGEVIPGGRVTKLWAFLSMGGKRILCVMAESDHDKTIHVRGDSKSLLSCVFGAKGTRNDFVGALEPGMQPL